MHYTPPIHRRPAYYGVRRPVAAFDGGTCHAAFPAMHSRLSTFSPQPSALQPFPRPLQAFSLFLAVFSLSALQPFGLSAAAAAAPTPPQLVVIVDQTPVIIEAPKPFVEISHILPDTFAQRSHALAAANGNRLLSFFIPLLSLKDYLDTRTNEKAPRSRILQIQSVKDTELVRYDTQSFKTFRNEALAGPAMPAIEEDTVEALFTVLNLKQLIQKAGGQKILGLADLGPDSFTLCIATGTEGSDRFGGREVETAVTCVTYMLVKGKILLLSVSGTELSSKELRNSMRLSREWLALLRDRNPR